MYLDAILEVAIGLVFAWLVLSVGTMQIQEWIGAILSWRARFLEGAIRNMLYDENLVEQFYAHPVIRSLSQPGKKPGQFKKPSYIPAQKFAAAMFDVILNAGKPAQETAAGPSLARMRASIATIKNQNPDLATTLESLLSGVDTRAGVAEEKLAATRTGIETWFNDTMDRLSGWYKRHAQKWAFIIGLGLALLFNVDTVNITNQLWREPTVRQALVAQAETFQLDEGATSIAEAPEYFEALALPVGWATVPADDPLDCRQMITLTTAGEIALYSGGVCRTLTNVPPVNDIAGWLMKIFGLLLSGAAAMQGAPFWFDILKKLVNIRGTGPAPSQPTAKN